jgi:hypothetical protein
VDHQEVRAEFVRLAASKRSRSSEFTRQCPTEWRPHSVIDPKTNQPFTDAGAWDFVVEKLEAGLPLVEVELDKPPGKKGYVLRIPGGADRPFIYVKMQRGSGRVIGRSFHYDDRDRRM